jgi:RimJ/RimL family protein N-acetyltransferase
LPCAFTLDAVDAQTIEARLRDGSAVRIRPIEPGDEDHVREVWDGMSELSRRRRFLAPTNDISEEDLRYLVDVDHRRHEALLALDEGGRAIAVARYVRLPDDRTAAEVSVVVIDDWHRRGLGTALLGALTDIARANGIERYTAIVSPDNDVVLGALDRVGAERTGQTDEGEIEFSIPLPSEGIGERLAAAMRAAAEFPLDFFTGIWSRLSSLRHAR